MASFIFEEGTQDQASGFTTGDTLIFKSATPATLGVSYAPAADATHNPTVTLTYGSVSLTFAASTLSSSSFSFLAGGTIELGTPGADAALSLTSDTSSAAYGLAGNDTLSLDGAGDHVVDMGSGDDTLNVALGITATGNYVLQGGAGADNIDASNATGNLHIYGNAISSVQGASDGADTILLGHGAGGLGANNYVNGNAGDDTITASAASTTADVYRLNGGAGNDVITGGFGVNSINGNVGNDSITGHGTNDYLRGGQGDDTIVAGDGNTQLFGDLGDDVLHAGSGINVLTGGDGADTFDFSAANAGSPGSGTLAGYFSEITDFTSGTDSIHLATAGTAHILLQEAGATFSTESAAQTYAQQLLNGHSAAAGTHDVALIQVGGDTYLFSHEGAALTTDIDTVIKLDGVTAANVKAADFV